MRLENQVHIQRITNMRAFAHRDNAVKDLGVRWPGSTRCQLSQGAAIYGLAALGKLAALKVEYEASMAAPGGFSSDSAQNLMKGKAVSKQRSNLLEYVCPNTGLTPLMAAVMNGHYAVVKQLLGYGAKVDATGHKGRTALQQLLKHGDLLDAKMLTLLLDAGASPFVADNSGRTALEYALGRHCHRFARFPGGFEQMLQTILNHSICAGPAEVKVSRAFGLSRPWVRRYCALVPQYAADKQHVNLVLMLLDEKSLTLIEKLTVKDCKKSHYAADAPPHIHLTMQQPKSQRGCMRSRDTHDMLMQLRAASPETEQDVVINQLTELAEMHPESVQFWLQGQAFRQILRQTSSPSSSMQLIPLLLPTKSGTPDRAGRAPLHRNDTCRLASFRRRSCTLRHARSLGIVDSGILMSQPLPDRNTNPHGVLDSADSLFDTLTFHFQGV